MPHKTNNLDAVKTYKGYTPAFKKEVAHLVEVHGTTKACHISGVSPYTALAWHRMDGYKPKLVGAPKGNLNALGGRIANMVRHIPNSTRLMRARAGPFLHQENY